MKQIIHIPLWRTTVNWILAVITGSILWPFMAYIFAMGEGENDLPELFFAVIGVSFILSGLCSLPALVLLLVLNKMLNQRQGSFSQFKNAHRIIHVVLALLTFFVIGVLVGLNLRENYVVLLIGVVYTVCGIVLWEYTFFKVKKSLRPEVKENDELLDNVL